MCALSVLLCTVLTCAVQVELKTIQEVKKSNHNALEMSYRNLNKERSETKILREFTDLGPQPLGVGGFVPDDRKVVFKREAKKPKNTKRRKKISKKKLQEVQDKSHSERKSEQSKSEDSEKSETAPDSESSDESDTSYSDSSDDSDESDDHSSDDSEDKSDTTEEVSLTSEEESEPSSEETQEIYSGPDSSPPASSDSTDESSASRAISQGSSEVSYTMSSSAEDAFPNVKSDSSGAKSEKEKEDNSKSAEKSKKKPKVTSNSGEKSKTSAEPKVTTKVKKQKGKKITEIKIKLDKNKQSKGKAKELASNDKTLNKENKLFVKLKGKKKLVNKEKIKPKEDLNLHSKENFNLKAKDTQNLETKDKPPLHLSFTTKRTLNMAKAPVRAGLKPAAVSKVGEGKSDASKERPKMEMLKVKPAVDKSKREDLEHDLLKDYPENGTVEIVNWEGTFAPIHGEPYVAPVHYQPDSFWDAIYRSTDPDLPTPPGVDISIYQASSPIPTTWKRPIITTLHPDLKRFVYVTNEETSSEYAKRREGIEMKNKDKGKKEKKKPKLSPKEKKKKKREEKEKENPNNFARAPGKIKMAAIRGQGNIQIDARIEPHVPANHMRLMGAGRSDENLKTPSEEERESGTTYKPEGAYEYPSFRHPDFNPDTAYDENGIPIHESPGWTPPPTLPGDHRFGKERSRAGAGLSPQNMGSPMNLHANIALQEHQHAKEAIQDLHLEHDTNHNLQHPHDLHVNLAAKEEHSGAHPILPPQHNAAPNQDRTAIHKIQKRKAALSESLELGSLSVSRLMTTQELNAAAAKHRKQQSSKEYKAYKLTDSELLNKEDSAPLEALNPALFMHKNMFQVKKKSTKNLLSGLPHDAEVIAVVVSPQDKEALKSLSKLIIPQTEQKEKPPRQEKPIVYNRHNEAQNPYLYKYRNMFKVKDLKDDGFKVNKEMLAQMALNRAHQKDMAKAVPIEEFLNGENALKGRGRENFNPIFINQNKMLHVKTNKFKATSIEHYLAKREVKDDLTKEAARPRPHIPKPPPPPPDARPFLMTEPAYKL